MIVAVELIDFIIHLGAKAPIFKWMFMLLQVA